MPGLSVQRVDDRLDYGPPPPPRFASDSAAATLAKRMNSCLSIACLLPLSRHQMTSQINRQNMSNQV